MHMRISIVNALLLPFMGLFPFLSPALFGQQFFEEDKSVTIKYETPYGKPESVTKNCGIDTIAYPENKLTNIRLLAVNPNTSGFAISQYYDAPAPLMVYGFDFFGYAPGGTGQTQTSCEIYLAGPDSTPAGNPLSTVIVPVDSNPGVLTLPTLRRKAVFPSPVAIAQPYCLVFRNANTQNVSIAFNDWDFNDGQGEWLTSGLFQNGGGVWTRGYDMKVGTIPLDADALLHPYVEYDVTAAFVADITCMTGSGDSINFWNKSSPIVDNRMYNAAVAQGIGFASYRWDFGDLSLLAFAKDTNHNYSGNGPYDVIMTIAMGTWAISTCNVEDTVTVGTSAPPEGDFLADILGFKMTITDLASGAVSYNWDFGDGNNSTLSAPIHTYTTNGNFTVTLITTNNCGSDTTSKTITINCTSPPPVADFGYVQNLFLVNFSDSSTDADTWLWKFGDGGTSSLQNPGHIYSFSGMYFVELIASNLCYSDTTEDSIYAGLVGSNKPVNFSGFAVYPNPGSDQVVVRFSHPNHGEIAISLQDVFGKVLESKSVFADGIDEIPFDITGFHSGMYLLQVHSRALDETVRFFIE